MTIKLCGFRGGVTFHDISSFSSHVLFKTSRNSRPLAPPPKTGVLSFELFQVSAPVFFIFDGMEMNPAVQRQGSWAGEVASAASDCDDSPIAGPQQSEKSHNSLEMVKVETELLIEKIIPKVAKSIAEMEVTNPEILRVTSAFATFQNFAAALRLGCDGDFYHKSWKSHKISTFWSHSWHGGQWKKILTLLTFYNGFAALLGGFLVAILMMILFGFDLLPGLVRGSGGLSYSMWCVPSGFLATTLVMLFWRSRKNIFLDRICISQRDNDLKAQAIFSLAGLLKKSDVMLILWDPTWTERLWCLFELAAFLKSKKVASGKQALIVRPISFGPISIAIFIFSCTVCIPLTTAPVLDSTFAPMFSIGTCLLVNLDIMKQQLLEISFDTTKSSCCEKNHQKAASNGECEPILCDRKVVKECVNIWFGSQDAFEQHVRSEVLEILTLNLQERVFTMTWALAVTSPFLWTFMDLSVSFIHHPETRFWAHPSVLILIEGLMLWFVGFPSGKDLLLIFCRVTRAKHQNLYLEILKNLLVVFACAFFLAILFAFYVASRFANDFRTLVWAGALVFYALCMRLLTHAMKAVVTRLGW